MLLERIKKEQYEGEDGKTLVESIKRSNRKELKVDVSGCIRFGNRLWFPPTLDLRIDITNEAHASAYTIHLGSMKMYKDLKRHYWWEGIKRDAVEHVAKCLVC